jgi:hypothetical protein
MHSKERGSAPFFAFFPELKVTVSVPLRLSIFKFHGGFRKAGWILAKSSHVKPLRRPSLSSNKKTRSKRD